MIIIGFICLPPYLFIFFVYLFIYLFVCFIFLLIYWYLFIYYLLFIYSLPFVLDLNLFLMPVIASSIFKQPSVFQYLRQLTIMSIQPGLSWQGFRPFCRLCCWIRPCTVCPLRPTLLDDLVLPYKSAIGLPIIGAVSALLLLPLVWKGVHTYSGSSNENSPVLLKRPPFFHAP